MQATDSVRQNLFHLFVFVELNRSSSRAERIAETSDLPFRTRLHPGSMTKNAPARRTATRDGNNAQLPQPTTLGEASRDRGVVGVRVF